MLISKIEELFYSGGFSNLNIPNLKKHNIYNEILELIQKNEIKYDITEYCSILIDKYDDYIMYISICED